MKKLLLVLLSLVSIILVCDLFHPGYPLTHDGRDHVVRIANFYESLQEGVLIPRWAGNLNWGYGHPVMEFLYPLPSYLGSLFHSVGFSLINSYKLILAVGIIASGFAMYFWLQSFLDPISSTFGAVIYMFAPYRMVDAYVRGDIGENLAFVFIPLVLWAIRKVVIAEKYRYVLWGSIFWAALILSHNAVALMILPVLLVYAAIHLLRHWNAENVIRMSILFALGFGLAAFFWIPALLEGKYTLRNIVTSGQYQTRFVSIMQLLYGPWNYGQTGEFTLQLGIVEWAGLLVSTFWIVMKIGARKIHSEQVLVTSLCVIASLISIFLMLPQSNGIWVKVMMLQNFQFPWRFLGILVFTTATLSALMLSQMKKYRVVVMSIGLLVMFTCQWNYFRAQKYIQQPESYFTGVWGGTTDTGESTPIWSIRWMEQFPDAPIDVLSGNTRVVELSRTFTQHIYLITASTPSTLMENTLYFPGWHIFVDGKEVPVQYQDSRYHGQMEFTLPSGTHKVQVVFTDTRIRSLADMLAVLSGIAACLLCGISFKKKKL